MINFIYLALFVWLQLSNAGATQRNNSLRRQMSELYTTSSGFRWTVKGSESFQSISASKIPKFESIVGSFILDIVTSSSKFDTHSVKATVAQVKKQNLSTEISELMIESEIKIIYSSVERKRIDDFSSRLSQIFSASESLKPLVDQLQKEQILLDGTSSKDVTFPSIVIAPTEEDGSSTTSNSKLVTTLTVSVIILIGLLLTVSISLVYFAKGKERNWFNTRNDFTNGENSKYDIKQTNTKDTMSSSDSPRGILGAKETYALENNSNSRKDGALVSMTPKRGVYDSDYDCNTPGSLTSDMTNTTQFSDTSKKPLGIIPMGKLDNLLADPRRPQSGHAGLYQMDTP